MRKLTPKEIHFLALTFVTFFIVAIIITLKNQEGYPLLENSDELLSYFHSPNESTSSFRYSFNRSGILHEAESSDKSSSPYWWLDSGGELLIENGIGKTIEGKMPFFSKWRLAYRKSNPRDTDDGYHPQNIFRLLTKSKWQNMSQQVYFRITALNLSESEYRNESNGVFLMNRYLSSDDLYYTGFRVDGAAVIKKKKAGIYFTLAYAPVFITEAAYDPGINPNFIPGKRWIGIKAELINNPDGTITIRLYIDKTQTGVWVLSLEAKDDGRSFGGGAISESGFAGIRADFMDVEFENYEISAI